MVNRYELARGLADEEISKAGLLTLACTGTLGTLAGSAISPALPHIRHVFEANPHGELLSKMVGVGHAIVVVLIAPFAGVIADRFRPRSVLILGLIIYAIGGVSGFWLPEVEEILVGRAVLGIGLALVSVAALALIGEISNEGSRNKILGRQVAVASSSGLLVLAVGAAVDLYWRAAFLVYSFSGVLILFAWRCLPYSTRPSATQRRARNWAGGSLPSRYCGLFRHWAPTMAIGVGQLVFFFIPIHLPFLIQDAYRHSALATAWIMAAQVPAVAVTALLFPYLMARLSRPMTVAVAFCSLSFGFAFLSVSSGKPGFMLGMLFTGIAMGVLIPAVNGWVLAEVSDSRRVISSAYVIVALFLGQFLSPFMSNPLVHLVGVQRVYSLTCVFCLSIAVVFMFLGRNGLGRSVRNGNK